jgi:hypothetical protein
MFNKGTDVDFEMDTETPISIEAVVGGKYIRATHWQPAEYPTVDSVRVMFGKIDVTSEIGSKEMERIKEQAMDRCREYACEAEEVRRYG